MVASQRAQLQNVNVFLRASCLAVKMQTENGIHAEELRFNWLAAFRLMQGKSPADPTYPMRWQAGRVLSSGVPPKYSKSRCFTRSLLNYDSSYRRKEIYFSILLLDKIHIFVNESFLIKALSIFIW